MSALLILRSADGGSASGAATLFSVNFALFFNFT
jgi:hypothetical protein